MVTIIDDNFDQAQYNYEKEIGREAEQHYFGGDDILFDYFGAMVECGDYLLINGRDIVEISDLLSYCEYEFDKYFDDIDDVFTYFDTNGISYWTFL